MSSEAFESSRGRLSAAKMSMSCRSTTIQSSRQMWSSTRTRKKRVMKREPKREEIHKMKRSKQVHCVFGGHRTACFPVPSPLSVTQDLPALSSVCTTHPTVPVTRHALSQPLRTTRLPDREAAEVMIPHLSQQQNSLPNTSLTLSTPTTQVQAATTNTPRCTRVTPLQPSQNT